MTQWIQDPLPGLEFLDDKHDDCPWCRMEDAEFAAGESCD